MTTDNTMDCMVNREIMSLVLKHHSVPAQPDGKCACDEESSYGAHQADHLIEKMVEHFGLGWEHKS